MSNSRVNRIFSDISFDSEVIIILIKISFAKSKMTGILLFFSRCIWHKMTALSFHFIGSLPSTNNDFSHTSHCLRVTTHHGDSACVVQNIFSSNGLFTNTTFSERHIFCDSRTQMMTDHQHIKMLIDGIHREGPRRVGRGG